MLHYQLNKLEKKNYSNQQQLCIKFTNNQFISVLKIIQCFVIQPTKTSLYVNVNVRASAWGEEQTHRSQTPFTSTSLLRDIQISIFSGGFSVVPLPAVFVTQSFVGEGRMKPGTKYAALMCGGGGPLVSANCKLICTTDAAATKLYFPRRQCVHVK